MKIIPIGKLGKLKATVDDEDYPLLSRIKWQIHRTGKKVYAAVQNGRGGDSQFISMHRLIMAVGNKRQVDHKDGDGLNNQKDNLRIATCSQNGANKVLNGNNKTGFKGVRFYKRTKMFIATAGKIHLGYFKTAELAATAYDKAATARWGRFALTNKKLGLL